MLWNVGAKIDYRMDARSAISVVPSLLLGGSSAWLSEICFIMEKYEKNNLFRRNIFKTQLCTFENSPWFNRYALKIPTRTVCFSEISVNIHERTIFHANDKRWGTVFIAGISQAVEDSVAWSLKVINRTGNKNVYSIRVGRDASNRRAELYHSVFF